MQSSLISADNQANGTTSHTLEQQQKALASIIKNIQKSLDLDIIFQTAVTQVREQLNADRVAIFQFYPERNWEGEFVYEDVAPGWNSVITSKVYDQCFEEEFIVQYEQGRIQAVADIYDAGLTDCHEQLLSTFQIRANLVVALLKNEKLWGLICIHQCEETRNWQESEIEFIQIVADHLMLAVRQAEYSQKLELQNIQLINAARREEIVNRIVNKIRAPLDIDTVFQIATQEIREIIKADRVAIFRFHEDWSGNFIAESYGEDCTPLVGVQPVVNDTYIQKHQGGRYADNQTFTVNNIYEAGLQDCHIALVEQFGAKAFATAPIMQGDKLWGIIAAYQNSTPRIWQENEVQIIAQIGTQIGFAIRHNELLKQAQNQAELQKALTGVITHIRDSWDLDTIFQTTVVEVRQLLKADRVGVFCFDRDNDWEGKFIYEDIAEGWISAIATKVYDHCFSEDFAPLYAQGRVNAIADIYQQEFADCYISILEQFQVRANIVAPLLQDGELWGLLCIHQCGNPRHWQESEIEFVSLIAQQLGMALKQDAYVKQVQTQAIQLAEATERDKAMERQKLLAVTIDKIRKSLDIDNIFKTTTQAVRELLEVERVSIYRFDADWRGKFVADSFKDNWQGNSVFPQPILETFADADDDNLPRHEAFVPISQGEKLWGLLVAYQYSRPRYWEEEEVNLLAQIGVQLGIATQQAELLAQTKIQATELAKSLEDLKQIQAQLIQGEKMAGLGELMAGVAHEINNPVNFIFGNIECIGEYITQLIELIQLYRHNYTEPTVPIAEHIQAIDLDFIIEDLPKTLASMKTGSQRITDIVQSLRNFSRKDESEFKAVDIHAGLDSTLLILNHKLQDNGKYPNIKVVKNYGNLPLVLCYPAQLNQVFMNILDNGIDALQQKFQEIKGKYVDSTECPMIPLNIWIKTQVTEQKIIIKIRDSGAGMPEELSQRIFDPFFTTKGIGQGTGLGLSIAYQIVVEKHQGAIQCLSKPGQGTEFIIEIPRRTY
ncbi:MAG: GAF domain-containing protein [Calothrix sp. MO_167.B42]|nr:GAF domain-containing protein [Calothrix sp. MO_167.B42]